MNICTSFSKIATISLLNSNFFYPSNYKLRCIEDKGSIKESLSAIPDLFAFQKKRNFSHLVGKPFRAVARAVAMLAIGALVAPAGVIYHTLSGCRRIFLHLKDKEQQQHHWEKVKEHALAFFTDLFICGTTAIGIAGYAAASMGTLFGYSIFLLTNMISPMPKAFFLFPEDLTLYLTYSGERSEFYKPIILKQAFGIVNHEGKMLTANSKIDDENLPEEEEKEHSTWMTIYNQQNKRFLEEIENLKKALPANLQSSRFSPSSSQEVREFFNQNAETFGADFDKNAWIKRFAKIENNIHKIQFFIKECIRLQNTTLLIHHPVHCELPSIRPAQNEWEILLDNAVETIKNDEERKLELLKEIAEMAQKKAAVTSADIDSIDYEGPIDMTAEEYLKIRTRVANRMNPHAILGFESEENVSPASLKLARDKALLVVSRDKIAHSQTLKEHLALFNAEAQAITYCISQAYLKLLNKCRVHSA